LGESIGSTFRPVHGARINRLTIEEHSDGSTDSVPQTERHAFVKAVHGVRYQVKDVARSAAFYTQHLGFTLEHQQLPAFASVSLGDAQLLLSAPARRARARCPTGNIRRLAGAIASCWRLPIFLQGSPR
jgi:Glyoxalase/Bleomycin resistance protein/Dioxygenase superfamily